MTSYSVRCHRRTTVGGYLNRVGFPWDQRQELLPVLLADRAVPVRDEVHCRQVLEHGQQAATAWQMAASSSGLRLLPASMLRMHAEASQPRDRISLHHENHA